MLALPHNRGLLSGFSPKQLPGLVSWGRMGGAVAGLWPDASGNGVDMTLFNAPTLNGDGTVRFDGINQYGKIAARTLSQPTAVFMLFKPVAYTLGRRIFDGNASLSMLGNNVSPSPRLSLYAGSANACSNDAAAVGSYCALCAIFNGANSTLTINGTVSASGDPGASNAGGFHLASEAGGGNPANLEVAEWALCAADPGPARSLMLNYFARLKGLSI